MKLCLRWYGAEISRCRGCDLSFAWQLLGCQAVCLFISCSQLRNSHTCNRCLPSAWKKDAPKELYITQALACRPLLSNRLEKLEAIL